MQRRLCEMSEAKWCITEAKCLQISYNKFASQRDAISYSMGNLMLSHSAGMHNTDWQIYCMNFFTYFIRAVSSVFTSLSPTSRIKKIVFHFTAVCSKWTRTARSWWLNLYTGHAVWQTFFWIDSFFSRLLNLNPKWGKRRCALIWTSLDFYRADMHMRTIKI